MSLVEQDKRVGVGEDRANDLGVELGVRKLLGHCVPQTLVSNPRQETAE